MAGWLSTMAAETCSSDWRRVHSSRLFSETYGSTTNEYFNKGKLFKNPCSQAELNKIVPFGFSLQRQKMVFFCH